MNVRFCLLRGIFKMGFYRLQKIRKGSVKTIAVTDITFMRAKVLYITHVVIRVLRNVIDYS